MGTAPPAPPVHTLCKQNTHIRPRCPPPRGRGSGALSTQDGWPWTCPWCPGKARWVCKASSSTARQMAPHAALRKVANH